MEKQFPIFTPPVAVPSTDLKQIEAMGNILQFGITSGLITQSFVDSVIEAVKNKSDYPENPEDLCDMHEVRHITGVSAVTVYQWVKDGILTKFKVGTRTRFLRSQVKAMIRRSDSNDDIHQLKGKRGQYHKSRVGGEANG